METAIDYFNQALAISQEVGNRQDVGIELGNLGNAYYSLSQLEKAIDYHEMALAISQEIGDRHSEGNELGYLPHIRHFAPILSLFWSENEVF